MLFIALSIALLLASCGKASNKVSINEQTMAFAPTTCELPQVIAAFNAKVPGSQYVPTKWEPAAGSDLYDALNSGGIACSYGIQSAEVGGTILWANISGPDWEKKKIQWLAAGQKVVLLPDLDVHEVVAFTEGTTAADERHVWILNVYSHGVWIQINASFLQTLDDAKPIITATIESLRAK